MQSFRALNFPSGVQKFRAEHQENKKQLKSDLKKGTAYAKKISAFTVDGLQQCIKDVDVLNLTPYISEIVDAILVVDFKITDVPAVVGLCVSLHRRYEDFTPPLIRGIRDALMSDTEGQPDANKKKRIQLRFFIELFQSGLHCDEEFFCQYVRKLLGKTVIRYFCNYTALAQRHSFIYNLAEGIREKEADRSSWTDSIRKIRWRGSGRLHPCQVSSPCYTGWKNC